MKREILIINQRKEKKESGTIGNKEMVTATDKEIEKIEDAIETEMSVIETEMTGIVIGTEIEREIEIVTEMKEIETETEIEIDEEKERRKGSEKGLKEIRNMKRDAGDDRRKG